MRRPHILIVDSEPRMIKILTMVLGERGYRMSSAQSAVEAQVVIDSRRTDLVLMECELRYSKRIDLAAYAKDQGSSVVLMSGDPDDIVQCEEHGDPYLIKPFTIAKLVGVIKSILGRPVAGESPLLA
jgi:DNA-binding response OmpR family regulator